MRNHEANIVKSLVDAHRKEMENHAELLWELINLEVWFRLFIDQLPTKDATTNFAKGIMSKYIV